MPIATRTIGVFAMMLLYAAAKVILYKSNVELFVWEGVEKKAYTERYTRAYTGWKVNLGLHEKG